MEVLDTTAEADARAARAARDREERARALAEAEMLTRRGRARAHMRRHDNFIAGQTVSSAAKARYRGVARGHEAKARAPRSFLGTASTANGAAATTSAFGRAVKAPLAPPGKGAVAQLRMAAAVAGPAANQARRRAQRGHARRRVRTHAIAELRSIFSQDERDLRDKAANAAKRAAAVDRSRAIRNARIGLRSEREASTIEALEDLTRQLRRAQSRRSTMR